MSVGTSGFPWVIHNDDALTTLATMPADSFDAMLCDPPYGLRFMGKAWDYDVPSVATWREALRVLKPGAFALVACGTRTQHRMVVNLEDAGFEIRDVVAWLYAQGFPKSLKVDAPGWDGYGTALKPAMELWTLVRKPLDGTVAANALKHGVGGLNIDGSRIPSGDTPQPFGTPTKSVGGLMNKTGELREKPYEAHVAGRWPANVIHDGSDEVLAGFPESVDGVAVRRNGVTNNGAVRFAGIGAFGPGTPDVGYGGEGSAARFFYQAKASQAERDAGTPNGCDHPTVKPIALTTYLARLILPPERDTPRRILVPFAGVGSEMIGARLAGWDHATGIEREPEYAYIANERLAHHTAGRLW